MNDIERGLERRLQQFAGLELCERLLDGIRVQRELCAQAVRRGPAVAALPNPCRCGVEAVAFIGLSVVYEELITELFDD